MGLMKNDDKKVNYKLLLFLERRMPISALNTLGKYAGLKNRIISR